jgi:ABC-2 type transport system permease protein
MSAFLRAMVILWRAYLLRVLLTKRSAIVLLGCAVPPTFAWLVLAFNTKGPPPVAVFMFPSYFLVLMLMVPLAAVIAGSAVVADEVDDRTITYLLTRPIARPAILLGRWLATLTILFAFVATSVFALRWIVEHFAAGFDPSRLADVERGHELEILQAMSDGRLPAGLFASVLTAALLGVAVYSAVFAVLGTFLKYPMIVGLGYAFAIEVFLANLPGKSQALTIQFYLRSYVLSSSDLWSHFHDMRIPKHDSAAQAVTTLCVILIVALITGSLTISRRQYVLSA